MVEIHGIEECDLQEAQLIIDNKLNLAKGLISDGSHTFNELYYHRMVLFATILKNNKDKAWKSKKHSDGSMYENYFIVGIDTPNGQYSYHYHMENWKYFSDVKELEFAPQWDGHQPDDVVRLLSL
nr:MAG TPA: hypothetical protein [Bacteriophage sp.]